MGIRWTHAHADPGERRVCLAEEHLRPGRAQELESDARLAQQLGQARIFRGAGGDIEIRGRPGAVHHPLHQLDRAIVCDEVEHRHEARLFAERGAEGSASAMITANSSRDGLTGSSGTESQ